MRMLFVGILMVDMFWRVTSTCDKSTISTIVEGNLGQAFTFPWLGVLRVKLQGVDKTEIALSGLVLVRKEYALVNADDVGKIPENVFRKDTRAMFMVAADTPWYCHVKSYFPHPEYEQVTSNTIAIVELNLDNLKFSPLKPICWSKKMPSNAFRHLYVAGYTDDNLILEKVIYKVQHVEKTDCESFYQTAGLADTKRMPTHYECGWTPSNRAQCVWDNGMVLVAKTHKHFTLIGFGIHGPGCGALARFIDMKQYYNWVENYITVKNEREPMKTEDEPNNIPLHELFHVNPFRRTNTNDSTNTTSRTVLKAEKMHYDSYPFEAEKIRHFNVEEVDNSSLVIYPFDGNFELFENACSNVTILLYREYFELKSKSGVNGLAYYKVSLYDLTRNMCSCIKMKIEGVWHSNATFAYKEFIDLAEGTAFKSSEETPDRFLKYYPINEVPKLNGSYGPKMKPTFLIDSAPEYRTLTYDLFVRFSFEDKALLTVEMYAEPTPLSTTTTTEGARRAFAGLTSEEERVEYLKQRRTKMTRPPPAGRKMWYDEPTAPRTIRSGFIKSVPETVSKNFEGSGTADDNTPGPYNSESDATRSVKRTAKFVSRTVSPVSADDFLKYVNLANAPVQAKPGRRRYPSYFLQKSAFIDTSLLTNHGTPKPVYSVPEIIITSLTFQFIAQTIIFLL